MTMKRLGFDAPDVSPPPPSVLLSQQPSSPKPSLRRSGTTKVQQQQEMEKKNIPVVQFFPLFAGLDHYMEHQFRESITLVKTGYTKLNIAADNHREYRIHERNIFDQNILVQQQLQQWRRRR